MRRWALGCFLLSVVPHIALAQSAADGIDALYQCFRCGTEQPSGQPHSVDFGPGSELFFFEQLGAAMQMFGDVPPVSACEHYFVEPYLKAHTALHGSEAAPAHGAHLPLSTGVHFGREQRLIHLASHMGGTSHVSAHADLVRHAMAVPQVTKEMRRLRLSTCAKGQIMQGAQVPDLYLFDQPLWHGQSEGPENGEGSRLRFVALVVDTVARAHRAAQQQAADEAMVLLGAAAHAVQDLYYHRGMTQQEKAALTYVAFSNPDWPFGASGQRLGREATHATSMLLAAALRPMQPLVGANEGRVGENHEELRPVIEALWPEGRPVDHASLRSFFSMSGRDGGAVKSDAKSAMARAKAMQAAERGRWATDSTLAEILRAL